MRAYAKSTSDSTSELQSIYVELMSPPHSLVPNYSILSTMIFAFARRGDVAAVDLWASRLLGLVDIAPDFSVPGSVNSAGLHPGEPGVLMKVLETHYTAAMVTDAVNEGRLDDVSHYVHQLTGHGMSACHIAAAVSGVSVENRLDVELTDGAAVTTKTLQTNVVMQLLHPDALVYDYNLVDKVLPKYVEIAVALKLRSTRLSNMMLWATLRRSSSSYNVSNSGGFPARLRAGYVSLFDQVNVQANGETAEIAAYECLRTMSTATATERREMGQAVLEIYKFACKTVKKVDGRTTRMIGRVMKMAFT
jgi:hypothetical protein